MLSSSASRCTVDQRAEWFTFSTKRDAIQQRQKEERHPPSKQNQKEHQCPSTSTLNRGHEEKQKLLEAVTLKDKIETLENIISFYLLGTGLENQTVQ